MSQYITTYDTLDIIDNISDHMPELLVLSGLAPLDTENADNEVNVINRYGLLRQMLILININNCSIVIQIAYMYLLNH